MGKEHELLEAARTGNLQAVKTILAGKLPRTGSGSGGLTSGLRSLLALKPVNINCKDASGETPLHLSALNGHREVVQNLLASRAVLTEVDCQGCTPLHLAAWNGHADICDLLLHHATDKSIVNAQTNVGETPLHFAAQHGHLDVVSLLLQNKADPTLRTLAERSALDLAAQYGKTGVVRTLVTGRHELLSHVAGQPSPLHLAAFNGHLHIVGFLLDSGFPVNTRTDNGTALHEAATSCKLDVIKLLLDRGVDVWAKAKNNMTAEDILRSTQSRLTQEALQIISGHVNSQRTPDSDGEKDINGIPGPGRPGTAREATPPSGGRPVPKPRSMFGNGVETPHFMESNSAPASSSSEPQSPPPPIPPRVSLRPTSVDAPPQHDPTIAPLVDTGPPPTGTEAGPSRSRDASPMSGSREQPKKPPRKTPSMRKTETTTHHQSTAITTHASTSGSSEPSSSYDYDKPPHPPHRAPGCDTTDAPLSRVNTDPSQTSELAMGETQPETVSRDRVQSEEESGRTEAAGWTERGEGDVFEQQGEQSTDTVPVSVKRESIYANATVIAAEEEIRAGKPHSLDLEGDLPRDGGTDAGASESEAPESLSHYAQLPTPDYPPPSPDTAVQGIQQRLHPQDKRRSKDMEPTTESTATKATTATTTTTSSASAVASKSLCAETKRTGQEQAATVHGVVGGATGGSPARLAGRGGDQGVPQGGVVADPATKEKPGSTTTPSVSSSRGSRSSRSSSSSSSSSSVITPLDAVGRTSSTSSTTITVDGEVVEMRGRSASDWDSEVFAGLLRGSTPGGPRNVVSQICENVVVKKVRSNRRSAPSTIVAFDPLMESREEDGGEVFDADRVLDEIEEMTGAGAASRAKAAAAQQGQGRGDAAHRKSDEVFDDSEEWAKIAATLETFGVGMARESVFVREYEASFTKSLAGGPHSIQSVGEWLESLSLGQYENTLVANGFDDTDFLGGTIIEDADLAAIGITNEDHRSAIVTAAHRLPPVQPIDQRILPESVEKWLDSLRLGQYLDTFISHKYNTMLRVIKLWELELNTVLDITSLGHRKRILSSLGDRRLLERDTSMSPARVRRRGSEEDEPRSPFEHINLYRDYTGVKAQVTDNGDQRSSPRHTSVTSTESDQLSPRQAPLTAAPPNRAEENGPGSSEVGRDTQIHIRPPHLMHTTGSIKQWRHRPEVLIKGCCNYTAHYLGSSVVKELKGATSTQEGIAKLKKSTEVISKIPTIMLSISYKGVKFIDAKSKRVICDHEIANIFCACQDGDHMNFFAYVTKDKETSRHYCHVFSVRSREQAGEIILTLGEAFEIAYQMALKERKEEGGAMERQLSHSDQDDATSVSSRASVSTV